MGSSSDWKIMQESCAMLEEFGIPFDKKVVSAHRTPKLMYDFANQARANDYDIIIGSWWCSAFTGYGSINDNLTGDWCANRIKSLKGLDSLLSIVQMPGGIPVATTAIGKSGAKMRVF